jgi:hypothetical protein
VTIEQARPREILDLLGQAWGLSPREHELLELVIGGLVHVGGKEPGLTWEPGKIKHPELTGTEDGHAETSESGTE